MSTLRGSRAHAHACERRVTHGKSSVPTIGILMLSPSPQRDVESTGLAPLKTSMSWLPHHTR